MKIKLLAIATLIALGGCSSAPKEEVVPVEYELARANADFYWNDGTEEAAFFSSQGDTLTFRNKATGQMVIYGRDIETLAERCQSYNYSGAVTLKLCGTDVAALDNSKSLIVLSGYYELRPNGEHLKLGYDAEYAAKKAEHEAQKAEQLKWVDEQQRRRIEAETKAFEANPTQMDAKSDMYRGIGKGVEKHGL